MNASLFKVAKQMLKDLLSQCTEGQQLMFKKMYCHKNLDYSVNEAVDQIGEDKIDHALTQCERTIEKNKANGKN